MYVQFSVFFPAPPPISLSRYVCIMRQLWPLHSTSFTILLLQLRHLVPNGSVYIDEIILKGILKCYIQHTYTHIIHVGPHISGERERETLDKINRRFGDNKTQYCSSAHTHIIKTFIYICMKTQFNTATKCVQCEQSCHT